MPTGIRVSLLFSAVALGFLLSGLLQSCATRSRLPEVRGPALSRGFTEVLYPTETFVLYGLYHPGAGDVLRVYIEGDRHAWLSRTRLCADPTPHNPVALKLALADPAPGPLLYLAWPCQYVQGQALRHCAVRYRTSARLGEEIVQSLNQAFSIAKARSGAQHTALIGFSGGGGAAALLAARREDAIFLGSVAGNLRLAAWTERHGLTPLTESLQPFAVAPTLRNLPQRHLSSRADGVMPPELSAGFCRAAERPESCVRVSGIPHAGPWERV